MSAPIDESYGKKIALYLIALAEPLILMTLVVLIAPDSFLSPLADDPSKFLFFIVYFLPGLIIARMMTQSWRKTLGVGVAYIFLSPAYYFYAVEYACRLGSNGCVSI